MGLNIDFWKQVKTKDDEKLYNSRQKEMAQKYNFKTWDVLINGHKVIEIGYFYKINFLIGVFDPYQSGNTIDINKNDLIQLLDLCQKVLSKRSINFARAFLPPQHGLFFGNTKINDDYFNSVNNVAHWIRSILPTLNNNDVIYFNWGY